MFLLASVLFALHTLGRAGDDSTSALNNVTDAFTKANIVPDVIPTFNPNVTVSPIFTDSSGPIQVMPGMSLAVNDTQTAPQYILASNGTDLSMSNISWVVAIVDPDASSPQFLHFLGQDFVVDPVLTVEGGGIANATGLMNLSQALVEFVAPSPPPGPPHRYVVLVYEQPSQFNTTAPAFFNNTDGADISRSGFNISDFATKTSLGDPIAGSFFLVGAADTNTTSTTIITSTKTSTSTATSTSTTTSTSFTTKTSTTAGTSTTTMTSVAAGASTATSTSTTTWTSTATETSTTAWTSITTVTSTTAWTSTAITTSTSVRSSTSAGSSSSTAPASSSPILPSSIAPTSALSPPSPFSPSPPPPAAVATTAPSGAEKVTTWMPLLVVTTLSLGLVLV